MPAHQLEAIFIRIGLALLAGVLIGLVPLALRKAQYSPRLARRITFYAIAAGSTIAFAFYVWFLWNRFVPREPDTPPPLTYPMPPTGP